VVDEVDIVEESVFLNLLQYIFERGNATFVVYFVSCLLTFSPGLERRRINN
jgi:hypothetical protein